MCGGSLGEHDELRVISATLLTADKSDKVLYKFSFVLRMVLLSPVRLDRQSGRVSLLLASFICEIVNRAIKEKITIRYANGCFCK